MSANGLLQIALFLGVLLALTKPLGWYMAQVYEGKLPAFVRWMAPIENLFYRLCGVDSKQEMRWTRYAFSMLWFALLSMLAVYAMQRLRDAGLQCGGRVALDTVHRMQAQHLCERRARRAAGRQAVRHDRPALRRA